MDAGPDPLIAPLLTSQRLFSLPTFFQPANVLPSNSEVHRDSSAITLPTERTSRAMTAVAQRDSGAYISEIHFFERVVTAEPTGCRFLGGKDAATLGRWPVVEAFHCISTASQSNCACSE